MRKLMVVLLLRMVLGFWVTLFLIGIVDTKTAKGQEPPTVEGVWEVISVSSDAERLLIGHKITISRKNDRYEVKRGADDNNPWICPGNAAHIVCTEIQLLFSPEDSHKGDTIPAAVKRQLAGQRAPINHLYSLSSDGDFLANEVDGKNYYWDIITATGEIRNIRYKIGPGGNKRTLKRIPGPAKTEIRADRAYQADCGVVDPNRITPFPPNHEFCPGNLVCMTNFCGGGMGCPYVCCPKGLPYLNHCDCKCYATRDFDCHSNSYCKEKP
jgi:hypothetical protein